jgi:K+-sensing histidine kinase KdpD
MLRVDLPVFGRLFDFLLEDELSHLPSGSVVGLHARSLPFPGRSEPAVEIEVADNGPGLPTASLRSLLDPFLVRLGEKLEYGLNLMACYLVVYHHGGRIEVKDREAGGTVFLLTFPVTPTVATAELREQEFLSRVLLNDALWERLLATG